MYKKKKRTQALLHLFYSHILLFFLSLHPRELRVGRFDTGGRSGPRATARRRLVLVKTPEADRVRNKICREEKGGGGLMS